MAKGVERAVRTWLVLEVARRGEDGYGIVAGFASSLPDTFRMGLRRALESRFLTDEGARSLIDHCRGACPYVCCWK